jgi:hypothetical protein
MLSAPAGWMNFVVRIKVLLGAVHIWNRDSGNLLCTLSRHSARERGGLEHGQAHLVSASGHVRVWTSPVGLTDVVQSQAGVLHVGRVAFSGRTIPFETGVQTLCKPAYVLDEPSNALLPSSAVEMCAPRSPVNASLPKLFACPLYKCVSYDR